jgi:hypothetical protein
MADAARIVTVALERGDLRNLVDSLHIRAGMCLEQARDNRDLEVADAARMKARELEDLALMLRAAWEVGEPDLT